jgi:hypothetical protein
MAATEQERRIMKQQRLAAAAALLALVLVPATATYAGTERDQVYADGSATFHGAGIFTGTVNGKSGTASYTYEGVAPAGQPFTATWTLIGMTGSLARVNGGGTFGGSFIDVSAQCDGGIYAGTYAGAFVGS